MNILIIIEHLVLGTAYWRLICLQRTNSKDMTYGNILKERQTLAPLDDLVEAVVRNVAEVREEVGAGVLRGDPAGCEEGVCGRTAR